MKRKSFLISAFVCISIVSFAQTDFTGSYSIQSFQPNEDRYAHVIPKSIIIMQSRDSLVFQKVTVRSDGQETSSTDFIKASGDTLRTRSLDGRKKLNCGRWDNGRSQLSVASAFFADDSTKAAYTMTDVWSTSGGRLINPLK
jgi:hypothetical protein